MLLGKARIKNMMGVEPGTTRLKKEARSARDTRECEDGGLNPIVGQTASDIKFGHTRNVRARAIKWPDVVRQGSKPVAGLRTNQDHCMPIQ